jgi:phosphoribosylformylglycinamidine synthase subunit PurQ / glutaminase
VEIGIVVFPGSNCDADTLHLVRDVMGHGARFVWHEERRLSGLDAVVLPGGFAYGDYLRAGAIAATSPVVRVLRGYVDEGGIVLGICNGFQVLLEAGLLPGAMRRNAGGQFQCEFVHIRVERVDTPWTCAMIPGQVLRLPIAHAEGNYYADAAIHAELIAHKEIVFRYCDAVGTRTPAANPNGSFDGIAGVANREGTVVGLMPHPERAAERLLGGEDGCRIVESLAQWIGARGRLGRRPEPSASREAEVR